MPVREMIGLTKDSFVRSLGVIGTDDQPPGPPYEPPPEPTNIYLSVLTYSWITSAPILPGSYTFEMNLVKPYPEDVGTITAYLNGEQIGQIDYDWAEEFGYGNMAFGWPEYGYTGEPRAHWEIRNVSLGTTRHGTDIFSDDLSTIPQSVALGGVYDNPPNYTPDALSLVDIDGESWLKIDLQVVNESLADFAFTWEGSEEISLWWQFDFHISQEFWDAMNELSGPLQFVDMAMIYEEDGTTTINNTTGPPRVGIWYYQDL